MLHHKHAQPRHDIPANPIELDGHNLTVEQLVSIMDGHPVCLSDAAKKKISEGRKLLEDHVQSQEWIYGVNTGFGALNSKKIDNESLHQLQQNLIRSHACGVSEPIANRFVRSMLALRINTVARGRSGVRLELVEQLVEALNKNALPLVPCQGTVGASGDLASLSHLILGLMGEGKMWDPQLECYRPAEKVLDSLGLRKLQLSYKEGLALNNGTQFITTHTAHAVHDARHLIEQANIVAAVSLAARHGHKTPFLKEIHENKPHPGQMEVAALMDRLLKDENRTATRGSTHDPYSFRCIPQIHGVVWDQIHSTEQTVEIEMNSSNDNPLVFEKGVISGGNFHGQYIAHAADCLAIAVTHLCNCSIARLEHLLQNGRSDFLIDESQEVGLCSGFMIPQYVAAALSAENRTLSMPASVSTIPTCAGFEDIVSMGGYAARKAIQAVDNAYKVLAIELMAACQAKDLLHPHPVVRAKVKKVEEDRVMSEDIATIAQLLKENAIGAAVAEVLAVEEANQSLP